MMNPNPAATVTLTINGTSRTLPAGTTLAQLVADEGLSGKRIAVERNGAIVPKSEYAHTVLADGDRLEIVVAVGGG